MMTLTKTSTKAVNKTNKLDTFDCQKSPQTAFLQAVIESLEDGILIVNDEGKLIHANASARLICAQLNQENQASLVPTIIWELCQALTDNQNSPSEHLSMISDEIVLNQSTIFRVRARLVKLEEFSIPYFLITIENRYESMKNTAIAEIQKYELTPREAEIWCLHRVNCSRKDIADQLYISINTVKKHMKNIHAKRQAFLELKH
ncbi:helix-turn-helix transcriptional regulator [Fortiea contorta]|uniref:helix-turn-helix transcriptional regulator n=1 Tax=Fortiea contorta TaxID=1892405 RepID=UPI00034A5B56|nr:helix-turn-helix transcriptional regulator [Fortiea contorta]